MISALRSWITDTFPRGELTVGCAVGSCWECQPPPAADESESGFMPDPRADTRESGQFTMSMLVGIQPNDALSWLWPISGSCRPGVLYWGPWLLLAPAGTQSRLCLGPSITYWPGRWYSGKPQPSCEEWVGSEYADLSQKSMSRRGQKRHQDPTC